MRCPECNKKIESLAKYCPNCGHNITKFWSSKNELLIYISNLIEVEDYKNLLAFTKLIKDLKKEFALYVLKAELDKYHVKNRKYEKALKITNKFTSFTYNSRTIDEATSAIEPTNDNVFEAPAKVAQITPSPSSSNSDVQIEESEVTEAVGKHTSTTGIITKASYVKAEKRVSSSPFLEEQINLKAFYDKIDSTISYYESNIEPTEIVHRSGRRRARRR